MRRAAEQTVQDHDDQAEAEEGQHGGCKSSMHQGLFRVLQIKLFDAGTRWAFQADREINGVTCIAPIL